MDSSLFRKLVTDRAWHHPYRIPTSKAAQLDWLKIWPQRHIQPIPSKEEKIFTIRTPAIPPETSIRDRKQSCLEFLMIPFAINQ